MGGMEANSGRSGARRACGRVEGMSDGQRKRYKAEAEQYCCCPAFAIFSTALIFFFKSVST